MAKMISASRKEPLPGAAMTEWDEWFLSWPKRLGHRAQVEGWPGLIVDKCFREKGWFSIEFGQGSDVPSEALVRKLFTEAPSHG